MRDPLPTPPTPTPRSHPVYRTHRNYPLSRTPSTITVFGNVNGKISHSSPPAITSFYPWPPAPTKAHHHPRQKSRSLSMETTIPSGRPSCPPTSTWITFSS